MSFTFIKAKNIEDIIVSLDKYKNKAKVLAGGTDLKIRMRHKILLPQYLVYIKDVFALDYIKEDKDYIYISSTKTHSEIINNDLVKEYAPILTVALSQIGSPLIRNIATLGGNIVNASPAGDGILPLYLLDARVKLQSIDTERILSIKEFIKGPGKTDLKDNEFLKEIIIPKKFKDFKFYFEKVGQRNALAISIVSFAILYKLDFGKIKDFKLAYGAVYPTVLEIEEVSDLFRGEVLTDNLLKEAENIIKEKVKPIDDIRASSWYRREVSGRLIWRLKEII